MYLDDDPRPPLPEWIMDAYTALYEQITTQERDERHVPAIPRAEAVDVLTSTDELDLEPEDAEYALTRLIDRGYLYEVDSEIRVTSLSDDR